MHVVLSKGNLIKEKQANKTKYLKKKPHTHTQMNVTNKQRYRNARTQKYN